MRFRYASRLAMTLWQTFYHRVSTRGNKYRSRAGRRRSERLEHRYVSPGSRALRRIPARIRRSQHFLYEGVDLLGLGRFDPRAIALAGRPMRLPGGFRDPADERYSNEGRRGNCGGVTTDEFAGPVAPLAVNGWSTHGPVSGGVWAMGTPDLLKSFGDVSAVPTLFVFDRTGRSAGAFYGAPPELHADLESKLASLFSIGKVGLSRVVGPY